MEDFEPCGNVPATLRDLAEQGYTSMQRGGPVSAQTIRSTRIEYVMVIRGLDLPPCLLVQWTSDGGPQLTRIGMRSFTDDVQLSEWLQNWNIRLGRHERHIRSNM